MICNIFCILQTILNLNRSHIDGTIAKTTRHITVISVNCAIAINIWMYVHM